MERPVREYKRFTNAYNQQATQAIGKLESEQEEASDNWTRELGMKSVWIWVLSTELFYPIPLGESSFPFKRGSKKGRVS